MIDEVFLRAFGLSFDMHITRMELVLDVNDLVRMSVERYATAAEVDALRAGLERVREEYAFTKITTPELATSTSEVANV